MTIYFHVDYCKLIHCKNKANDLMIKWLRKECKSIFEYVKGKMAVSGGNVHVYLGITLDYRICGRVKITIFYYIEEIITAFEKAAPGKSGNRSSAAPVNILVVDKDFKKIK